MIVLSEPAMLTFILLPLYLDFPLTSHAQAHTKYMGMQEYLTNSDVGLFSFKDLFVYDRVCDQGLVLSDESIITRRYSVRGKFPETRTLCRMHPLHSFVQAIDVFCSIAF